MTRLLLIITIVLTFAYVNSAQTQPDLKSYKIFAVTDSSAYLLRDDYTKKGSDVTLTILVAQAKKEDDTVALNPDNWAAILVQASCSTRKYQRIHAEGKTGGKPYELKEKGTIQLATLDSPISDALDIVCGQDPRSLSASYSDAKRDKSVRF